MVAVGLGASGDGLVVARAPWSLTFLRGLVVAVGICQWLWWDGGACGEDSGACGGLVVVRWAGEGAWGLIVIVAW